MKLAETGQVVEAMRLCVEERMNILISGGTSTGKTTFARSCCRWWTLASGSEPLRMPMNSSLAGECCRAKGGPRRQGERTPARLLEASLRMRPDRIILGGLRGEESREFLEAINTGHGGSFTTIHAEYSAKSHRPVGDNGHGRRARHGVRGGKAILRRERGLGGAVIAAGWATWGGGDSMPLMTAKAGSGCAWRRMSGRVEGLGTNAEPKLGLSLS